MKLRILCLGLVAGSLSAVSGCGDSLEEVFQGSIQCETPCELSFNGIDVERPSNFAQITLLNDGLAPIEIVSIRLEGTSPYVGFTRSTGESIENRSDDSWVYDEPTPAYRWGNLEVGDPFEIGEDEELQIQLAFGPSGVGGLPDCPGGNNAQCGTLIIETSDPENAEIEVPIELNLSLGELSLTPTVIDFPVPVAGQSYEECWTAENTGVGTLTISDITLTPAVAGLRVEQAEQLPLPIDIEVGGQRDFCAYWEPSDTTALNTTVTFASNDVRGGNSSVLLRSGGGSTPILDIDPCDNIVFNEAVTGQANEVLIEVNNPSERATLNINTMAISTISPSDARAEFQLLNSRDQAVSGVQEPIAPGENRVYKLVYTPTADRAVNGTLRVSGNFEGTLRECRFSAGPAAPQIQVVPNRLFWAGLGFGESDDRSFVIYNSGRATLSVNTLALAGPSAAEFAIDATAPLDIEAGGAERVTVTYARPEGDFASDDTAQVQITHNDPAVGNINVFLEANHSDQLLPPTCVIGVDPGEPYTVGQTITLNASGSAPPAGGEFVASPFNWTLTVPSGSSARLSQSSGETVTLSFDTAGLYEVVLQATATINATDVLCESDPFNLRVIE
jgi:hypothetical protein